MSDLGRRTPIVERIMRHVDKTDPSGCWLWTGHKLGGYGYITEGGQRSQSRLVPAHRVLWESVNGPMPAGLESGHRCPAGARKDCVNPAHIEAITHSENQFDRYAGRCKSGRHDMSHVYVERDGRRKCAPCHNEREARYRKARAA